jgi:hypothetical protein
MRAEDAHTQKLIDASSAAHALCHGKKKDLLSQLSDAPSTSNRSSSSSGTSNTKEAETKQLPALTPDERALLEKHASCTRCRRFNAGHNFPDCPMKADNTWLDATTYVMLTVPPPNAATKGNAKDDDTDSYVPPPFTVAQLYTTLYASGPLVTDIPIAVQGLMDIGCSSTVISLALCELLGLRQYPLLSGENNMSSLSELPLNSEEYVKLDLQSELGVWKLGVHKMNVVKGLPFPIILECNFLRPNT